MIRGLNCLARIARVVADIVQSGFEVIAIPSDDVSHLAK